MTTGHAGTHGPRKKTRPPSPAPGSGVPRGTRGWYGDASGAFLIETPDGWNAHLAYLVFPGITSSARIDRCDAGPFVLQTRSMSALPVADQVRELQAALSLNKSELARILRVSRPTVYDWLGGGGPNADNRSRIRTLLRLVVQSRVSATDPLFPRFVKSALDPGDRILLDLLSEETVDEATAGNLMRRAKALGDAIDAEREEGRGGCGRLGSRRWMGSSGGRILLRTWG